MEIRKSYELNNSTAHENFWNVAIGNFPRDNL